MDDAPHESGDDGAMAIEVENNLRQFVEASERQNWHDRFKSGPAVEDLALDALERIAGALGEHRPKVERPFIRGQARFKIVCLEVFSQLTEREPRLNAAFLLVKGVEAGYIARRDLQKAADRIAGLSAEDRAFAVGMAAGFMTEFLPRAVGPT